MPEIKKKTIPRIADMPPSAAALFLVGFENLF